VPAIVRSNGEAERPRAALERVLCAHNTSGAHSAPHRLSRPAPAIVRRHVIDFVPSVSKELNYGAVNLAVELPLSQLRPQSFREKDSVGESDGVLRMIDLKPLSFGPGKAEP
jgi:hypothetical protein